MNRDLIERSQQRRQQARGGLADFAMIATIAALVASLAVAAVTVSIGIARADTLRTNGDGQSLHSR